MDESALGDAQRLYMSLRREEESEGINRDGDSEPLEDDGQGKHNNTSIDQNMNDAGRFG